jgi:hypothetical protein
LKGRIRLQIAEKSPLNRVELELVGIEETRWTGEKGKKFKGEHAFFSEKSEIYTFQTNEWTDHQGQYEFPFAITLPPNLPSSL